MRHDHVVLNLDVISCKDEFLTNTIPLNGTLSVPAAKEQKSHSEHRNPEVECLPKQSNIYSTRSKSVQNDGVEHHVLQLGYVDIAQFNLMIFLDSTHRCLGDGSPSVRSRGEVSVEGLGTLSHPRIFKPVVFSITKSAFVM